MFIIFYNLLVTKYSSYLTIKVVNVQIEKIQKPNVGYVNDVLYVNERRICKKFGDL